ncbi:MAG TPA: guanine deaminase [Casimicrobiaceae bacterium]
MSLSAWRGELLWFVADPGSGAGDPAAWRHETDGVLLTRDGRVEAAGPAATLLPSLPAGTEVVDCRGSLLLPGFVDTHVHYAQTGVIASCGGELLEWLERYTFPAEARFGDPAHARAEAEFFLGELTRNGTTTALVFATTHPASADAIFEAALSRDLCLVAGKVMMDRNCPEWLRDTAQSSYDDSKALIAKWHGRGRLGYAVTPRFAPTSTDAQLEAAGALVREHPGVWVQSHVAENRAEMRWVAELFPWSRSYLDVYDRFGLVGPRSVYAHCVHLDRRDRERMARAGAAMSFCPTSNLFLGSGLFDLDAASAAGAQVALGTDVGAGTSFSMLQTLNEAYKVAQLAGQRLSPMRAFYLATLGGAQALGLDARIGSFEPGRDADFVVLDPRATPLLAHRTAIAEHLSEKLFALMMLGDDRAVSMTCVRGRPAHVRQPAFCPISKFDNPSIARTIAE